MVTLDNSYEEYSTNGAHGKEAGSIGLTHAGDIVSDNRAETMLMEVSREEAQQLYKSRRASFAADPLAEGTVVTDDKGRKRDTNERAAWQPTPITQIVTEVESVPWLLNGYIARGHTTSLTGLWKAGKTTWVKYLLRAFCRPEDAFCGRAVMKAKALVISEESERLWAERRDELGLTEDVYLIAKPFRSMPPKLAEWLVFLDHLVEVQQTQHYDLIIFDSMHNLWGVYDEKDNAEILRYLRPLDKLAALGVALLLLAHPAKADSGEGRATRGGGAWGGFVDVILELRRHDASNREDTRRVLTAYSRWDDTPAELVVELDKDAGVYRAVGTKADASAHDRMLVYSDILPTIQSGKPGMTPEEVRDAWPEGEVVRPGVRTIRRDLEDAAEQGTVAWKGTGVKGDPKRYSIPATIES